MKSLVKNYRSAQTTESVLTYKFTCQFQEMDISANTFIDELVNCSGKDFIGDVMVKDKVCRFTFDIMLRCLMGDSSEIQTRE